MSVQQPAWLRKTRPCPFFSQGRCLFADSCNFLHDVKVRSTLHQPLPNASQAQQPPLLPKPVFHPPSVVVDSASPRPTNPASSETLTSPVQDSSRYSGLLSVLSDVIGRLPTPPAIEDAPRSTPSRSTAHDPADLFSESDPVFSDVLAGATTHTEAEASLVQFDPEVTLVDPFEHRPESFFPEEDGVPVAEFLSVLNAVESAGGDTSYFMEDTQTCVGRDDDEMIDHEGTDFTGIVSNRHSTLSSFTGASLLASPRNSVLEEFCAPGSIVDGGLLSPVELSTKLRPFPIPSLCSKVKRGDSIDSGYADGDSWVTPPPFPRSPPRSFRSPVTFPSHSRWESHTSPTLKNWGLGPYNLIERIGEVESHENPKHGSEDNEDTAFTILSAYETSPSEDEGEDEARGPYQVIVPVIMDSEKVEEEEVPAVMRSSQRYSLEHLHPIGKYDLDPCNVSLDENSSFKIAPSVQPSYEDLSNVSKVSPVKQDSLISSISRCSTPNTSVLSHYTNANEPSGDSIDGSHLHESYLVETGLASRAESTGTSNTPEESWVLGEAVITERLDSESDDSTQRLSFPLPPFLSRGESARCSAVSVDDAPAVASRAVIVDPGEDVSSAHTILSQDEKEGRICSGSDLTEKVRPNQLPSVGSPSSSADFTSRRSRPTSDLTVKGKLSPSVESRSPSPPLELQGQSDTVQSLYDQYFDHDSPVLKVTTRPDVSNASRKPFQEVHQLQDLTAYMSKGESSSFNSNPSPLDTSSPQSETILRPLLTGRQSFLRSSLSELILKTSPDSIQETTPTCPPARLQTKEIGSTMIPLGFRRHKPQARPTPAALQPPHTVLPASQLREVLRIRTDIAQADLPLGCSSANHILSATRSPIPVQSMSAPPTGGLKQLRLSSIVYKRSSTLSTHSSSIASSTLSLDHLFNPSAPQSPSVSSTTSFSGNSSLSPSLEQIPEQVHHTLKRTRSNSSILQAPDSIYFPPQSFSTRRDSQSVSAPNQQSKPWRLSHYRAGSRNNTLVDNTRRLSRMTSTSNLPYAVDEEQEIDEEDTTFQSNRHTDDEPCPTAVFTPSLHAIATPKPTLLFAIASDDVDQVCHVLESGEAGPNDPVGPQSALAFTLTNDKLAHKPKIVKALLAYGADPSALRNPILNPASRIQGDESNAPLETTLEGMDPATRYFVTRADTAQTRQTSQLIHRSAFRPLTRVRYDVIGQDWALEQLFRVLSMHSQKLAVAPIVVLLCGPSGHGKSLLARKFGSLLDVPTHTVNMTTLQSAHDIWQSFSMSPYEEPSSCTLAEFLIENEGKRCVVVLDEMEKVEDQKALWSLLMPWELGRCSLEAGKRHVDARNVVWLATSNVGHELVFEYHKNRAEPDKRMSREDYLGLMDMLRPHVSHCLGASLVSRVTTVLPFVPFTLDEKTAIAAEAVYAFTGDTSKMLSPQEVESLVLRALPSYHASEGARSLHRAISNILMDTI